MCRLLFSYIIFSLKNWGGQWYPAPYGYWASTLKQFSSCVTSRIWSFEVKRVGISIGSQQLGSVWGPAFGLDSLADPLKHSPPRMLTLIGMSRSAEVSPKIGSLAFCLS